MLNNLIYSIFIAIISGAITKKCDAYWCSIKEPSSPKQSTSLDKLCKIRKQFFISLFLMIICVIVFVRNLHPYLNFIAAVMAGFFIVILWGAFDAVYFPFKEIIEPHPQKKPNAATEDIK